MGADRFFLVARGEKKCYGLVYTQLPELPTLLADQIKGEMFRIID